MENRKFNIGDKVVKTEDTSGMIFTIKDLTGDLLQFDGVEGLYYRNNFVLVDTQKKPTLQDVFNAQADLNNRCGVDGGLQENCLSYLRAMSQEIAELTDCFDWKWWKQHDSTKLAASREELIDIFHFFISIALEIGMDADTLIEEYFKKNKINHERQDNGY